MPAFVIFALGESARGATFETDTVRVGRDPGSDIVLHDEAVSREHAVFARGADGKWTVTCVSQKNPIVVQGAVVSSWAGVGEGTEVLVGNDALIVFTENTTTARKYLGGPMIAKMRCGRCTWAGLVSKLNKAPVCPGCGSTRLSPYDAASPNEGSDATTHLVSDARAQMQWQKVRSAKHSFLERLGDATGKRRLSEQEPLEIGSRAPTALRLDGLVFGYARVAWDGEHYMVESSMKFPAMKVNGVKTTSARLSNGDLIEIGGNQFRFLQA